MYIFLYHVCETQLLQWLRKFLKQPLVFVTTTVIGKTTLRASSIVASVKVSHRIPNHRIFKVGKDL